MSQRILQKMKISFYTLHHLW